MNRFFILFHFYFILFFPQTFCRSVSNLQITQFHVLRIFLFYFILFKQNLCICRSNIYLKNILLFSNIIISFFLVMADFFFFFFCRICVFAGWFYISLNILSIYKYCFTFADYTSPHGLLLCLHE